MAWSDAGQRPEAMPVACTGCDFAVSNRPAVSTPATATYRCRSQSITASGMIYDHVSVSRRHATMGQGTPGHAGVSASDAEQYPGAPRLYQTGISRGLSLLVSYCVSG